jgi:hypothetical protein
VCKTGAGGKAGNKGGVAVRFRMYESSLCFVCAHLAAGQSHIAERNQGVQRLNVPYMGTETSIDYDVITKKIDFGKGRTIANHDYVFWFGRNSSSTLGGPCSILVLILHAGVATLITASTWSDWSASTGST